MSFRAIGKKGETPRLRRAGRTRHSSGRGQAAPLSSAVEPTLRISSLYLSDILKLNREEMDFLKKLLNFNKSGSKDGSLQIIDKYNLKLICLTDGEKGSQIFFREGSIFSQAYEVRVEDTVGSGDAFAAAFAIKYLKTRDIKKAADFANLIGGYVDSKKGATPEINWKEIESLEREV